MHSWLWANNHVDDVYVSLRASCIYMYYYVCMYVYTHVHKYSDLYGTWLDSPPNDWPRTCTHEATTNNNKKLLRVMKFVQRTIAQRGVS